MIIKIPQKIQENQAYDTHLNYIKCLASLMNSATLQYNKSLKKAVLPDIDQKRNLVELTRKSLEDEKKIVDIDKEYSYASTSWLPVKSYYLIFNVLLTLEYAIKIQKNIFKLAHTKCVNEFTRKLQAQEIKFSNKILNQVFDQGILDYKGISGANLSSRTAYDDMYMMAIRKIAKYKVDYWKESQKIELKKKEGREKYKNYLNTFSVSIFDFPYYMRIRANYRDFSFIDGVTTDQTANYFNEFFKFTLNFVTILEDLKTNLVNSRR